mgnify:CR=1 FL=1
MVLSFTLAASRSSTRTVAVIARIFVVTALLETKVKTYLITHAENVNPLLSNKLNIS